MQTELPSTQKDALATGSVTYFTGQACRNGHVAPRNARKGKCLRCLADKQSRRRERVPGEDIAQHQRYFAENAEAIRERDRARYASDPQGRILHIKRWQQENIPTLREYGAKRRAANLQATPPWLTPEHRKQMAGLFREARRLKQETGIVHHVDHIEPLQGKTSCGLHVPWNLQILTWEENVKKGNRLAA